MTQLIMNTKIIYFTCFFPENINFKAIFLFCRSLIFLNIEMGKGYKQNALTLSVSIKMLFYYDHQLLFSRGKAPRGTSQKSLEGHPAAAKMSHHLKLAIGKVANNAPSQEENLTTFHRARHNAPFILRLKNYNSLRTFRGPAPKIDLSVSQSQCRQ